MTGEVDAVHGLFYLLLHPIAALAGPDPFALRAPSAAAVALTVAAVYLLARRFGPRLPSCAAALLFLGLARTSWMETEARSFALATLVATVLTLLLVRALRSERRGWPIAYGLLALFGIHLYAFTALVVAAHAASVAMSGGARRGRAALWAAMATAGVLSAPLLLEVVSQRSQLGGTFEIGARTWLHVFVSEFFHRNVPQAIAAWALLLVAVIGLAARRASAGTKLAPTAGIRPVLALVLPWLILPTAAVVVFSWISPTIYQPRALVVCAPAFCVLLAELLRRAFRSWTSLAGAVLVAALGIPSFLGYRELTAKGADWPLASAELAARAEPGDAVLYSEPVDYRTWPSLMRVVHPDRLAALDDVALVTPYRERPALFDERAPVGSLGPALAAADRVWYVSPTALDDGQRAPDLAALVAAGLEPASVWEGPRTVIQEWRRDPGAT
nr:glycosyltransferase family 39 protein [Leucobacter chromiisoli]